MKKRRKEVSNLEDWRKTAQETFEGSEGSINAEITEIEETTAEEIFGEENVGGKNQSDPDREFLLISVETEDGEAFSEPMSLPISVKSWKNRNFKMGRFKKTYGHLPEEGQAIEAELDDSGMLRIKMR